MNRSSITPRAFMLLVLLAVMLAGSVVSARVAMDHGVGVTMAVAVRSLATAAVVAILVFCSGASVRTTKRQRRVLPLIGLLAAGQSICLYTAVSRLPVVLALLAFNSYPLWTALIAWTLYHSRPERSMLFAMPVVLAGLALALHVTGDGLGAGALASGRIDGTGVALAALAAFLYAMALVLTQHEVSELDGRVRSVTTMLIVGALACGLGWVQHAFHWPGDVFAWLSLAALSVLYGSAITLLFALLPRLGVVGNSPILNIEPIAALALGWLLLGQSVGLIQMGGVALVVGGVLFVGLRKRKD